MNNYKELLFVIAVCVLGALAFTITATLMDAPPGFYAQIFN